MLCLILCILGIIAMLLVLALSFLQGISNVLCAILEVLRDIRSKP